MGKEALTEATNKGAAPKGGKATVEQTYQKLTQHQHILKRPDTYIGSIEKQTAEMFVMDPLTNRMVNKSIQYVPGLYKIFDEIVVNAADNKQRDNNMNELKIEINREKGQLSVYNNGRGIPVMMHKEHKIYVPELIFGHLLAGSNFDDDQKKTTGGRNGYGAKLANIFSSEFIVETADADEGKVFKQVFQENMVKVGKPKITAKATEGWTKITWTPDWPKFGMDGMDDDIIALFTRRAYDMAGCTHQSVKVYLNGKKLPANKFADYVDLYLGPKVGGSPRCSEKVNDRWEVSVAPSDDGFQQVSFVNSIATTKGGTHVSHVADQVVEKVLEFMKKKHKGMEKSLKPAHVKAHMKVCSNQHTHTHTHAFHHPHSLAHSSLKTSLPGLRQLPHREPGLRLPDEGVHDP